MNKRQRKKNIKRAMERARSGTATKQDKHILKTYGRKDFQVIYKLPPELIGFDAKVFIENVATAFRRVGLAFGQALESVGRNIRKTFEYDCDED